MPVEYVKIKFFLIFLFSNLWNYNHFWIFLYVPFYEDADKKR